MMRLRIRRALQLTTVAIAAIALGLGCGGSGGGGGPTAPPPPSTSVRFTADASPGANSVYLGTGSGSSGTQWVMDISVQSVSDLYGVSLLIDFPTNQLSFNDGSEEEGTFLSGNGEFQTDLQVRERNQGEVTVGISRIGLEPGATGSGRLLSLRFSSRGSGSGDIRIRNGSAVDSLGVVQDDVTFIGGSVTVN